MSASGGELAALRDDLEGASTVLILAPSMEPRGDEACARLLAGDRLESENVLCVTLADSPDDRLAIWRNHGHDRPASVGFVDVGDPARSATASSGAVDVPGMNARIETVSSPADLTGLAIKISGFLDEWEGDGRPLAVCFHSLSTLLQFVDLEQAFRFAHVLTGRFATVDAASHFHLDPTAHDDRTINTLKPLFDAVVELGDDGTWTAARR